MNICENVEKLKHSTLERHVSAKFTMLSVSY